MDFKDVLANHKNKDAIITIRVTKEFKKELKQYATSKKMTITELVLLALKMYIEQNDKGDSKNQNLLGRILNIFRSK